MMYGYGNAMDGWGYALMTISFILLAGLAVYGIVALGRHAGRGAPEAGRPRNRPGRKTPKACSPGDMPAVRSTRTSTSGASPSCGAPSQLLAPKTAQPRRSRPGQRLTTRRSRRGPGALMTVVGTLPRKRPARWPVTSGHPLRCPARG